MKWEIVKVVLLFRPLSFVLYNLGEKWGQRGVCHPGCHPSQSNLAFRQKNKQYRTNNFCEIFKTSCVTDILPRTGWINITRNWSNRETRIISSGFVFLNLWNHWHGIRIISHHDSHGEHRVFYYKPVPKINWMGANWEPGTLDPITLSRKDSRPWQSGSDTVSHPGESRWKLFRHKQKPENKEKDAIINKSPHANKEQDAK